MTFTEAAVQVLRLVGKPLHYKEITDVAIEKDLLSHVGKSPEVTMGARLAAIVKKDPKETQLVRIKPGVFALAEWDSEVVEKGLADRTPALKRIEQREKQGLVALAEAEPEPDQESAEGSEGEPVEEGEPAPATAEVMDDDEIARAELTAAATELFEAEDDDDEPIFGRADDDEDVIDEEDDEDVDSRRRGRRRRRRGRAPERNGNGDDDLPTYTVSDATEIPAVTEQVGDDGAEGREARREPRREARREPQRREGRDEAQRREGRDDRRDDRREERRDDRRDGRDRPRPSSGGEAQVGREL